MSALRPLILVGTRPEAIKLAPVIAACRASARPVAPVVCFTGQHERIAEDVATYFGMAYDMNLRLMAEGGTLDALASRCISGISGVLAKVRPDCVVAQGDTTTVFAAAVSSFHSRVPFVHVEAGLRSGDLRDPWPEEFNRRTATLAASLHCAPTEGARRHLLAEGVPADRVHVTGNTVIDALLSSLERERPRAEEWRRKFPFLGDARVVLVTAHRRESFGAGIRGICAALLRLSASFPDVRFVYPVHPNPEVDGPVRSLLSGRPNLHLLPPLVYPEFVWLLGRSHLVLTDSGGVQEEAVSLRRPILVMRRVTERPEGVEAGATELVGVEEEAIVAAASRLLSDPADYARHQVDRNPYGDGKASGRIVGLMLDRFGGGAGAAAAPPA